MSARITSLLRRPDGIYALLSRRSAPFERPLPPRSDDECAPLSAAPCPYVEVLQPLAELPAELIPARTALQASWNGLAEVKSLHADMLVRVLHVLTETLPDPDIDTTNIPPLRLPQPPRAHRPTAAHPRAYRGTRDRPPKPPQPQAVDLRPHLCAMRDERRVLAKLAAHFDAAMKRGARAGLELDRFGCNV
ncbi:MAG TPA: hypothetical protein VGM03_07825, partial [Phycisphaerae bacterium]